MTTILWEAFKDLQPSSEEMQPRLFLLALFCIVVIVGYLVWIFMSVVLTFSYLSVVPECLGRGWRKAHEE